MAASLAEEHPELFHYTGINGLQGILESQSLWATHSSFLNDTTEIEAFKKILPDILRPAMIKTVDRIQKKPNGQALIEPHGGIDGAVQFLSSTINDILYDVFRNHHEDIYIASFCTHKNDEENQHGSLSQWRGYGQDGGYAIVFDGKLLDNFLAQERVNSGWYINSHRVAYSPFKSDELSYEKFREELGEDLDILSINIGKYFEIQSPELFEHLYAPYVRCACSYKHWGFHEENEVRIIALPQMNAVVEELKTQGLLAHAKERHYHVRGDTQVPCIHLFEGITQLPDNPLPITRIIVGPHRDKEKRQHAVESLLRQHQLNIPVSVSEIPYVGNY